MATMEEDPPSMLQTTKNIWMKGFAAFIEGMPKQAEYDRKKRLGDDKSCK